MSTNRIGLDTAKSQKLAEKLNNLLANYQIFYMNVRGYHWNIQGPSFFELHVKFEEQYNDLLLKVDELAERILTLGHRPLHAFSDYIAQSAIKEHKQASDGKTCVEGLLTGYKQLIEMQRELLELAGDAGDEGTASLMSDYIGQQEKTIWMLSAYLAS
ncbi:Dps family protein [Marinospirillum alkaliphilum]|uniref:Starvation-inducible DNA-binding protein n=1 Tax=Marinospirillum alkaliphilum DSM 21637 TaxID=1122209 RepID=A0A1K1V018_9GAMM|nr:Dps family protein [Marinospirillum alkaliphilum]SFX18446.1 starvation-inducible DNA-binding protein [Marinospirillum alkaliphilum DSM 21637]